MKKFLKNTFALDDEGAVQTLKTSIWNVLVNITVMFSSILVYMFLRETIADALNSNPITSLNFWKYLGIALLCFSLTLIFYYKAYHCFIYAYNESANKRKSLAETLRKIPLSFFAKRDLSDLSVTIMNDTRSLEEITSHFIPPLIGSIVSTIIIAVSITAFNVRMGLSFLWVIVVAVLISILTRKIQVQANSQVAKDRLVYVDKIEECIENVKDIRANNRKSKHTLMTSEMIKTHEHSSMRTEFLLGVLMTLSQSILKVGIATSMIMASYLLITGEIDLLLFILFLVVAMKFYDPLTVALINMAALYHFSISANRIQELENTKIQTGKENINNNGYNIVFDKVGFSYHEGESILTDVSFTAKQGTVVALVGPSGSGKSTILKLASRFWDIDSGVITLGGEDISKVDPEELLKNISIVFQDVTLFDNTVMENIRIGKKDATDEEVIAAAKHANCHEFIEKMADGYNTMIGENGQRLSGGQRQRLSIARALLKDAPIILLDEATSSLDVKTEKLVQSAIKELIKDKTVMVIAHRMRTIVAADKIVYLENGQVGSIGTHDELMRNCSGYAKMINLQIKSLDWKI